jgi:RND family efflux transporter MFP subunit
MRASVGAVMVLVVLALMAISFAAGLAAGTPVASPTPVLRPTPTPTPQRPTPSPSPTPEPGIRAAAVVVPLRSVELGAPYTTVVEGVFVREGQTVSQGQLLVRLDTTTRRAALNLAQADLRRATAAADRAQLIVTQLPPDASPALRESALADLRLAQAEVRVAETALEAARAAFDQTEVRAPFAGTIAALDVDPGEHAVEGRPLVAVADVSGWLFETIDITELDVVRIAVGDRAAIRVAAMPERTIAGVVEQIRVRGASADGGVRFDVLIRPADHHPELRWNMSAEVRILPGN